MSQLTDSDTILKDLHASVVSMAAACAAVQANIVKLNAMIVAAQAGPPEGKADGSISPSRWTSLTEASRVCARMLTAIDAAKGAYSG